MQRRACSIPPSRATRCSSTGAPLPEELTLLVYPDRDSRGSIYEDDGTSRAWQTGGSLLTECVCEARDATLTLRIAAPAGDLSLLPPRRRYRALIHTSARPRSVRLAGASDQPAWDHDGAHTLSVVIPSHAATLTAQW